MINNMHFRCTTLHFDICILYCLITTQSLLSSRFLSLNICWVEEGSPLWSAYFLLMVSPASSHSTLLLCAPPAPVCEDRRERVPGPARGGGLGSGKAPKWWRREGESQVGSGGCVFRDQVSLAERGGRGVSPCSNKKPRGFLNSGMTP